VLVRWGSWVRCCVFYCENYAKIADFVRALPDDSKAVNRLKLLCESDVVQDELFNVTTYKDIPDAITALEEDGLTKEKQWEIFTSIRNRLDGFAKDKIESSLGRNPDVVSFATKSDLQFRHETRFAPLVSVSVERSFSLYKSILTDKRENLTFENIEKLNVISFNRFLFQN